jgi:peptidoglycan/xylan/chitin deacetylase (PgdA/CDA1 family)
VADGVRAGDVLLLHDADRYSAPGSWRATAAALPRVLDAIAAAGLQTVALSAPADLAQGR